MQAVGATLVGMIAQRPIAKLAWLGLGVWALAAAHQPAEMEAGDMRDGGVASVLRLRPVRLA